MSTASAPSLPESAKAALTPPMARGIPLVGHTLKLVRDPLGFLVEGYHVHGPIFRIRTVMGEYTVLAGHDANRLVTRLGDKLLAGTEYQAFGEELHTDSLLTGLDGAPHRHLRKILKPGYSKTALRPRLPELVRSTQEVIRGWEPGQELDIVSILKELVTRQLSVGLMNSEAGTAYDDLQVFFSAIIKTKLAKVLPSWVLRLPRYQRAVGRLRALSQRVVDEHRATRGRAQPDMLDDLLAAKDIKGCPMSDATGRAVVLATFLAGLDTVAIATSFALHNILSHPDVYARVTREVDAVFDAAEAPSFDDFKRMPFLEATVAETLRINPIFPFLIREAACAFEFEGHRVEAGQKVMGAGVVPHFLEQYFPDPYSFDPERHFGPKREQNRLDVLSPFGVGPHVCLGAGLGELQVLVLVATMLRETRLAHADARYRLRVVLDPVLRPDRKFKLRVVEHRGPKAQAPSSHHAPLVQEARV
jgi:cytochrome P450